MTRLPASLSIALWLVGSIWVLAALAHLFGASAQVVYAALAFGLVAGIAEWIVLTRAKH